MSWSIHFIGKPEKVAEALKANAAKLEGQSKLEYEAALPNLVSLVENNFAGDGTGYTPPLVRIEANGSGVAREDRQLQRSCTVKLEPFYAQVLL